MKVILVGCEYVGKSTLAKGIIEWTNRTSGEGRTFHDHFTIPNEELSPEAKEHLMAAPPQLKEMFQRFMIAHHLSHEFFIGPDQNYVGFHIEEAVYAPLYYGYGTGDLQGSRSEALRHDSLKEGVSFKERRGKTNMARAVETEIMRVAPDAVLVLLKATAEVIGRRMREDPHEHQIVREVDIPHVLARFEEEYEESIIEKKFVLDTTDTTPEKTLDEFLKKFEPYFTNADRASNWSKERLEQIDRAWASYL